MLVYQGICLGSTENILVAIQQPGSPNAKIKFSQRKGEGKSPVDFRVARPLSSEVIGGNAKGIRDASRPAGDGSPTLSNMPGGMELCSHRLGSKMPFYHRSCLGN